MGEILHLSDLHFGSPFLPDRADAVLELAEETGPDLVVVSGDLTQRAKEKQFAAAARYLDRLDAPMVVTPGNHDVPLYRIHERFFTPYRYYRRYVSEELDTVTRVEGMTVVALNSTRRFTFNNGRLERHQLEFAAEAFADTREDELRVVVTHHHLAPPPDFARDRVMPRARRALATFRELGVHLVLAGHMHRAYIGDSLDFFPGEEREEGIVIVQCGTTTSARGRGRERFNNSLNYISARRDRLFITHYLWRDALHGFWPHSQHTFGTRPDIWLGQTRAPIEDGGRR
jgi:3',5'-cyclic AMP phosphodiesterase CpdA